MIFNKPVAAVAVSAALCGGAGHAQSYDCNMITLSVDGVQASGSITLERGASFADAVVRPLIVESGGETMRYDVRVVWEGRDVILITEDGDQFTGRAWTDPARPDGFKISGWLPDGPAYMACAPAAGAGAPPDPRPTPPVEPEPEPDPRPDPEPPAETLAGLIDMRPGQAADLDRAFVLRGFAPSADWIMAADSSGTTFSTVGGGRIAPPYGFSSMSLQRRCENARGRGDFEPGSVPELTLTPGEELCFTTGEGRIGALIVSSMNARQGVFEVHLFD